MLERPRNALAKNPKIQHRKWSRAMQEEEPERSTPGNGSACNASKADGTPCGANVMGGKDFCFFHNPDMTHERKVAQRRGGKRNRAPVLPADVDDLVLNTRQDAV